MDASSVCSVSERSESVGVGGGAWVASGAAGRGLIEAEDVTAGRLAITGFGGNGGLGEKAGPAGKG